MDKTSHPRTPFPAFNLTFSSHWPFCCLIQPHMLLKPSALVELPSGSFSQPPASARLWVPAAQGLVAETSRGAREKCRLSPQTCRIRPAFVQIPGRVLCPSKTEQTAPTDTHPLLRASPALALRTHVCLPGRWFSCLCLFTSSPLPVL